MRPDIVPGATFPDYELSDHTAKRRKLSELQGAHPLVLVLSRGGYCPKDRRQAKGWSNSIANSKLPIAGSSPSAPTISPRRVNTAPESAPTGLFSATLRASSKRIWTSPNTPIPPTIL
jgi:hypothetical protein